VSEHPLTGSTSISVKLGQEMGADGYITKPFSSQLLVDTVDRLLTKV